MPGRSVATDRSIAGLFNVRLGPKYATLLIGGAEEPLYLPAAPGRSRALLRYTRDYARSALHELAHWSLAGPQRRELVDYGYWYRPPPRSKAEQARFFAAELRVQALECLFCEVCGVVFHVSADNIGADTSGFASRVETAARAWRQQGVKGLAGQTLRLLAQGGAHV